MSKTSRFPLRAVVAGMVLAVAGTVAMSTHAATPLSGDDVAFGGGPGGPHGMMWDGGGPGGPGMGMMGGPGGPGGPGARGAMGGRGFERMLDLVNATAEQRTQIRSIMQAARTDLQAQHTQRQALHTQMRDVFKQPNIDRAKAESLRGQLAGLNEAASKRMLQARLDAANVLTPAQRQQLADRMAQRQAMMERHRAERATLDGGLPPGRR